MWAALAACAVVALPDLAHAGLLPPPAPPTGVELPEPLRAQLAILKDSRAVEPALALVSAAFLYGVFHAVGPGHGKVVIGSWLASRRARIGWALAACGLSAAVQALAAIVAVAVLAGTAALAPKDIMAQAAWLEVASYALIAAIGVNMGWRALRGGHSCGHGHDHDHACCGHPHHQGDDDNRRDLWAMAAAVGFRPCSGAILVLLFTLANGLFWIGILATFAMAVGVGLTVSGIGLSALGLNRLLDRGARRTRHAATLRKALALAGAMAVTLLGVTLLLGAVQSGAPTLTG
jgi:ABC-type nickel/cobalt efflux system permease component RcnA